METFYKDGKCLEIYMKNKLYIIAHGMFVVHMNSIGLNAGCIAGCNEQVLSPKP